MTAAERCLGQRLGLLSPADPVAPSLKPEGAPFHQVRQPTIAQLRNGCSKRTGEKGGNATRVRVPLRLRLRGEGAPVLIRFDQSRLPALLPEPHRNPGSSFLPHCRPGVTGYLTHDPEPNRIVDALVQR